MNTFQEPSSNGESKIRKVLFNEISLMVAGVGLVSSVLFWVLNPQQKMQIELTRLQSQVENNLTVSAELAKIRNNDLNEIEVKLLQLEERQIEVMKALARLEAVHAK